MLTASSADVKPWLRAQQPTFVFADAAVVDVLDGSLREPASVAVRRGRIVAVVDSKAAALDALRADAAADGTSSSGGDDEDIKVIDCSGKFICPGLIDTHVHLIAVPGFNDLSKAFGNPHDVSLLRQPYVCAQMLHRGFTTVRDCGGAHLALKEAIEDGVFSGPRLFLAGHALSQSGGHADYRGPHDRSFCECGTTTGLGRVCNGVAGCMQAVREEIRAGADFIKIMGSGGVSSPTDRLDQLQFTTAEIRAMVECADNAGTYVTAHAYTPRAIRHCIDAGVRGIEHGNFLDPDTAALMAARGCFLTPTLVTYAEMADDRWRGYLPPESASKNTEVLRAGQRALRIAHDAGVTLCFGTDLLGPLGRAQPREFALRAEAGLPPLAVLQSATVNAARLLRHEAELGQVRAGFAADLLVLAANPLADVAVLDRPDNTVLVVMKDGRVEKSRWAGAAEDAHVPVRI